ncbi:hypothetical protein ACS0TY_000138 [Phlomoides rotata]
MANPNWLFDEATLLQAAAIVAELGKRPRAVFEMPSISNVPSYAPDNERAGLAVTRNTESINALYESYLRNAPISYGTETGRSIGGYDGLVEINDLRVLGLGCSNPNAQSQVPGVGGISETSLPPDASATLFVEGLPASCTRREVSHIFRPFHGYKEVRVVMKEPKRPGGDPVVLCFVDFVSPAHAATVKDALQGYVFDEEDHNSCHLRLHFSHTPGARSGFKNPGRQ